MFGRPTRDRSAFLRRHLALTADALEEPVSMSSRKPKSDAKRDAKPESSPAPPPASPPESADARPTFILPRAVASVFRPGALILLAAGVSAIAFAPRLWKSLPDLSSRPEFRLAARDIEFTPPPRWVPLDFVEQVIDAGGLPQELSLLDGDVAAKVASAFRRHPWVADVTQVRTGRPEGVRVDLKYREPAAMVSTPRGTYPVDANAILLPPADIPPADVARFPLVQNVESSPGPAGEVWNDPAVVGAARLAALLQDGPASAESTWKRFRFAAIRVPSWATSNRAVDDVALELHTTGGSRILWGRPPGTNYPGELSIDQKLGRLEKYVRDYGGFDLAHGPYEIDIRHWQEISRRSLAAGGGRTRRR